MNRLLSQASEREEPSENIDRRAHERHYIVYRIAKVERSGDAGLWRVRNISDRGISLSSDVPLAPNERLAIALSDSVSLPGEVIWARDGACGVAFDTPVKVGSVLRQLVTGRESPLYRPLRLSVACPAKLRAEGQEIPVMVTSISQHGMGFVHDGSLESGAQAEVALGDDIWRGGVIRWISDCLGGLRLRHPFSLSELESVGKLT